MHKALTLITLFILLIGLIGGCSNQDLGKREYYEKGLSFLKNGNPNGAIIAFKNAIEEDQNYFEARYQLALAYILQNKYESAERELIKVLKLNPSFDDARVSLAKTYIATGRPDDALKEVNHLQKGENDAEVYELMGTAYALKSDYAMAREFLNKSLKKSPNRTSAKLSLAGIYIKEENLPQAEAIIREILKSDNTKNKKALYLLASVKAEQGNLNDAVEAYQKIIDVDPKDILAQLQLGLAHLQRGELDKAAEIAQRLTKSHPKMPEGHYLRGLVFFYEKKIDEALVSLQESVKNASIPGAHYYLGLCHLSKGNLEQATSEFQRVVDLKPEVIQARLLLAMTHLRNRRADAAIKEAQKVVDMDEDNALAHNVLGSAYIAVGKNDLAMEEFNRAIELDPKLIDAHIKKGAFNLLSGHSEKAEKEFQTAVEIAPDILNTRIILAQYYMKQKRYKDAINTLKEGLRENPNDTLLYNIMGMAYVGSKDIDTAIKHFEKAIESAPRFFLPYFNLATLYISKGNRDKAINEYKRVLEVDSNNIQALISLALIMEAEDKDAEVIAYYKKAIAEKSSIAYLSFAGYHLRKKDSKKALEVLDEALSINPRDINALDMKGSIYQADKNYKDALSAYRDLKTLAPERGTFRIAGVYEATGDYDKAIEELKELLAKKSDRADILGKIAALYIKKKDFKEAEETAKRIIFLKPKSDSGYRVLAAVYLSDRYFDKALDTLKKAEGLNPDNLETEIMIGEIYMSMGSLKKAMEVFKKVEKLKPEYAPAYFFQGSIFELMGDKKSAVEMHKKAVARAPNYVKALNNLAYFYAEGYGSINEAIDMAQRAKKLVPKDGSVTDTLGWVLFKKGNYDDALRYFIEATYYFPGNPTVRYHLALAYMKKGMRAQAEEQLKNAIQLGKSSTFPELNEAQKTLEGLKGQ